jgi:hypothetical protein
MSTKLCSSFKNVIHGNQNRWKYSLLQIVSEVKKFVCALVHFNMGTPSSPDHITT